MVAVSAKKFFAVSGLENSLSNALKHATGLETGGNEISSHPHTLYHQHLLRLRPALYVYFSQVIFFNVFWRDIERKNNFGEYIVGRSRWLRRLRRRFSAAR